MEYLSLLFGDLSERKMKAQQALRCQYVGAVPSCNFLNTWKIADWDKREREMECVVESMTATHWITCADETFLDASDKKKTFDTYCYECKEHMQFPICVQEPIRIAKRSFIYGDGYAPQVYSFPFYYLSCSKCTHASSK